jgi:hypothetical protein
MSFVRNKKELAPGKLFLADDLTKGRKNELKNSPEIDLSISGPGKPDRDLGGSHSACLVVESRVRGKDENLDA